MSTEISLLDAFGLNVSDDVHAINQEAADLSMNDMAQHLCIDNREQYSYNELKDID